MEDLDQVAAFVAVAETMHLGRAATGLGVSRSTVSGRLRRLEDQVGMVLIDRSHRCRIALTAEGSALLPAARTLVGAGRGFGDEIAAVRSGRKGVVRVALTTLRSPVGAELERAMAGVHEGWRVEVTEMNRKSAARALAIGGIDCVLSSERLPATTRCGVPTPGPNRRERHDAMYVSDGGSAPGVLVTWRRRWMSPAAGGSGTGTGESGVDRRARSGGSPVGGPGRGDKSGSGVGPGCGSAARTDASSAVADGLMTVMRRFRRAMFADVPMSSTRLAQWRAYSRRSAAERDVALWRREVRREGYAEAARRERARKRRRWLIRLWKGWARGDRDVCEYVDWIRERGGDPGLGRDPDNPPRGTPDVREPEAPPPSAVDACGGGDGAEGSGGPDASPGSSGSRRGR